MTPETAAYLERARQHLDRARHLLDTLGYTEEAARAAYLAAFHAAQALIFARTGRTVKSHSGLRSAFAQVTRHDPTIDREHTRFLARAYKFKEIADYGVGSGASVQIAEADEMIETARRFVDIVAMILT
ncbi:MAG TPA: HEPN domain-containing protein [Stellaceae bacterium]|nr:HEPN domain-containing protein [Stellaceae bacterium]